MSTPAVQKVIDSLANDLREGVAEIEASTPTTRGHYGTYMGLFSQFADDAGQGRILAKALIKAGANERGVNDALRVSF
jgi:RNA binding exosome subunit